jgi:hypothetical protein
MPQKDKKNNDPAVPVQPDVVLENVYQKGESFLDQTETARKLLEAEERARLAVEAIGLGTFDLDLLKNEMLTSPWFDHIFGFDGPAPHREYAAAIHPDDLEVRKKAHQVALATGRLFYEARVTWKDGSVHWIRVEGKVYYNEQKAALRILGTVLDFTEHKVATAGIRESEQRRMLIMNAALDAIICMDTKGCITFWNPQAERIFGWPAGEVYGRMLSETIIPEKYRAMHNKGLENYSRTGEGPALNVLLHLSAVDRQQKEFPIEITILPINQGGETFFCAFIRDITERKRTEMALKESEKKFRTLAESTPQKVWSCNNNGEITYLNSQMLSFTGLSMEEHKDWIAFTHPEDFKNTEETWLNALTTGSAYEIEERFRKYDGTYRWHLTRGVPEKDENGNILMWIGTCTDIHDQKIMAEELESRVADRTRELVHVNEELKRTNQELEQFAYVASHDLQEPLRKIRTFSDYVISNFDKPDFNAKEYLERINAAGKRMSALIKDLLVFSKLSKIEEHFVRTDLNEILKNVTDDFELLINEKNAVIHTVSLPVINAIPMQINQLFYNLIGNSLKFSEKAPEIRISCRTISKSISGETENEGKQYVEILFADNGIGFEQSYADKVFTIFQRLNNKQQYEGTGIGLAMCKKIVENHFGHIGVLSKPNKGSTFIVDLPL